MRTIRGPGLFVAQFIGTDPPFDTLDGLAGWAAGLGFKGLQLPTGTQAVLDLRRAAESDAYCAEVHATLARHGLVLTELAGQRHGHLLAVHPAYDSIVDAFAPAELHGDPAARQAWARDQLLLSARACRRLGVSRFASFSGGLLWPYLYPYPPPPPGLIEAGFAELARRWRPVLDAFDENGVDVCFELHPGEDLHDGATFERFLALVDGHPRCCILYDPSHFVLQHLDYLGFIDRYHPRIRAFHVKDAELVPSARGGTYGGYEGWVERAGRFRSPGDGQVDFKSVFSRLTARDYDGWACLEWECALKNRDDGAREGAAFIASHIIRVTDRSFDAGMRPALDRAKIDALLGLDRGAPA